MHSLRTGASPPQQLSEPRPNILWYQSLLLKVNESLTLESYAVQGQCLQATECQSTGWCKDSGQMCWGIAVDIPAVCFPSKCRYETAPCARSWMRRVLRYWRSKEYGQHKGLILNSIHPNPALPWQLPPFSSPSQGCTCECRRLGSYQPHTAHQCTPLLIPQLSYPPIGKALF